MKMPKAYMSVAGLLLPPENSSGAPHASVMAELPLPAADADATMEESSWTAPPKSHNFAAPLRVSSAFMLLMSPCMMPKACR